MNSFQVQHTPQAKLLRRHYQYQYSVNQDIYDICQYALNQQKEARQAIFSFFLLYQMRH